MSRLGLWFLAALFLCSAVRGAPAAGDQESSDRSEVLADLGSYYVNPKWVHTSGISAGAYFAVQLALAHSSVIHGAGSIAGGPYYCAQGSVTTALTTCMSTPAGINVNNLVRQAQTYSQSGAIDNIENVRNHRNYIFAGKSDSTVKPQAGEKLREFWLTFQNASMLLTEFSLNAAHAHITDDYGNACTTSRSPYINDCDYDAAGILLQHMFGGTLKPRGTYIPANLIKFDQSKYSATSFQKDAYVYVPTGCQQGAQCGLHIALHGCTMNSDDPLVREQYVAFGGYNTWAESNNIIILYPQVSTSVFPNNPNACFDWWGYAGADYATKSGSQMSAIKKMIDQLMSGGPTIPVPSGLRLVQVADNFAIITWEPIPEATGYIVYRNGGQVTPQPIPQTQYNDTGLASGSLYDYQVAAIVNGQTGPRSGSLLVRTSGNPPPLGAPSLTVLGTTSNSVSLTWSSLAGALGYIVKRGGVNIANVTTNSYTDTGLQAETSYTYTVHGYTSSAFGPDSNVVTARTGSSWVCQEYYDNNYNHVGASRAYQRLGYVYAVGSDEFMGLYNIAAYNRLAETSADFFVIGNCP